MESLETLKNSNLNQFRRLANEISKLAENVNVNIISYRDEGLPCFSKLDGNQQLEVLKQLNSYLKICQNTLEQYGKDNFSVQMTWSSLKDHGLIPCNDLFDKITSEDVIEIHDMNHKQIFRNLVYFKYCSYSIEDLHCLPWTELYYRPKEDLDQLISYAQMVAKQPPKNTLYCNLGPHLIRELNSLNRYNILNTVKYYSPLFNKQGHMVAAIAIESPKLIDEVELRQSYHTLNKSESYYTPDNLIRIDFSNKYQ